MTKKKLYYVQEWQRDGRWETITAEYEEEYKAKTEVEALCRRNGDYYRYITKEITIGEPSYRTIEVLVKAEMTINEDETTEEHVKQELIGALKNKGWSACFVD